MSFEDRRKMAWAAEQAWGADEIPKRCGINPTRTRGGPQTSPDLTGISEYGGNMDQVKATKLLARMNQFQKDANK